MTKPSSYSPCTTIQEINPTTSMVWDSTYQHEADILGMSPLWDTIVFSTSCPSWGLMISTTQQRQREWTTGTKRVDPNSAISTTTNASVVTIPHLPYTISTTNASVVTSSTTYASTMVSPTNTISTTYASSAMVDSLTNTISLASLHNGNTRSISHQLVFITNFTGGHSIRQVFNHLRFRNCIIFSDSHHHQHSTSRCIPDTPLYDEGGGHPRGHPHDGPDLDAQDLHPAIVMANHRQVKSYLKRDIAFLHQVHQKHNAATVITNVMFPITVCMEATTTTFVMYEKNLVTDGQGRFHYYACGVYMLQLIM